MGNGAPRRFVPERRLRANRIMSILDLAKRRVVFTDLDSAESHSRDRRASESSLVGHASDRLGGPRHRTRLNRRAEPSGCFAICRGLSTTDFRLYALLAPHLVNKGAGNAAWVDDYKGVPMLFAEGSGTALALGCSPSFVARSVGFVGVSDDWQDLRQHSELRWHYDVARNGNVGLVGEVGSYRSRNISRRWLFK